MKRVLFSALAFSAILGASCEKDEKKVLNQASLPKTYNFENVDHSGQNQRLDMLNEVVDYAKTSNSGNHVEAPQLLDMLANQNYQWQNGNLASSSKQIADKLEANAGLQIGDWIRELDSISNNPGNGSHGNAGLVTSVSGTKQYLLNKNGLELAQLIEKGIMGALSYHQATAVYTSSAKMNVDNGSITLGKGTDMQHHWDEAFGYWNAPINFGTANFVYDNTEGYHRFWAKYTNSLNDVLNCNTPLMNAFIKGRVAINNNNLENRDAAITELRQQWQQVCAGMVIHYLNGAKADFADNALRNHQLSEAIGFLWSLPFNPASPLNRVDVDQIIKDNFGNLYQVTVASISAVRDQIALEYGLQNKKDIL